MKKMLKRNYVAAVVANVYAVIILITEKHEFSFIELFIFSGAIAAKDQWKFFLLSSI